MQSISQFHDCARWGQADDPTNAQFVVQPYQPPGRLLRFSIPAEVKTSTQSFTWEKDKIFFQSLKGHPALPPEPGDVIKQWTFTGSEIPQAGGENARLNLWLMGGRAPVNGQEAEIILRKFEWKPLP